MRFLGVSSWVVARRGVQQAKGADAKAGWQERTPCRHTANASLFIERYISPVQGKELFMRSWFLKKGM
jgi:hypothetical protein